MFELQLSENTQESSVFYSRQRGVYFFWATKFDFYARLSLTDFRCCDDRNNNGGYIRDLIGEWRLGTEY